MLRKWLLTLCISLIVSLLLSGCNGITGPQTVKVAVSLPLGVEIGQDMLNGIQLALDEANGQAENVTVELLVFDTSDPEGSPVSPELERQAAIQAIADTAVVAYLGTLTSDQAKISLPLLNEVAMAQISLSATWPGLTKPGFGPGEPGIYYPTGRRHFFRMAPSDEVQGAAAALWANQLDIETVYIVDDSTAFGRGVSGVFEVTAHDLGLEIFSHDSFDGEAVTTEELKSLAARVVETRPALLYYASGGSDFVDAVRTLNPNLMIMGPDGLVQEEFIADIGVELAEGIYGTIGTIPANQLETAAATAFLTSYQSAYGKEPPPYAVSSYEAMKVLLHAIKQAKEPTREGVLTAMSDLGEFSGVLGDWRFDVQGDISLTTISGFQVQDGVWSFVQIIR